MVSEADVQLRAAWEADDIPGILAAIRSGANPNATHSGMPVVVLAAGLGDITLFEELRARGADVDAPRAPGKDTALMFVVGLGAGQRHKEMRDALIAAGADVNARDLRGKSVLDIAVSAERLDDAEVLIAHGARGSAQTGVTLNRLRAGCPSKEGLGPS